MSVHACGGTENKIKKKGKRKKEKNWNLFIDLHTQWGHGNMGYRGLSDQERVLGFLFI